MCLVMQRENSREAFTASAPACLSLLFKRLIFLFCRVFWRQLHCQKVMRFTRNRLFQALTFNTIVVHKK